MYAQFTKIYIIALSGSDHGLDVTATGEVENKPRPYKEKMGKLA